MTFEDALRLVDYHYWARDRMLAALEPLPEEQYVKNLGNSFPSIRDTVVHTYGAEWAWYSRWIGDSPASLPNPGDFPDLQAIRDPWKSQEQKLKLFVGSRGQAGMARVFDYKSFKGDPMRSVFWHTLQHVVNHATFHRGQVTTMLRQLGAAPPKSQDLITYYRERSAH